MSKETGEISEDIALNLETNFEAVLTKTANLYTTFQKKVGSVSQSLVSNVNSMYRQVSNNLTAMSADVQNNTIKSINATRNGMRQVVDESIKASSEVRKNLDKVSGMRNTAGRIASSGDEKKINTFNDKMQQMYLKTEQETYLRLGAAAADSSQVIQKSSDDSLKSIEKLTTGTRKSFYQMRKDLEKNGDIVSALRAKDGVAELEKQLKIAEKSLAQQGKRIAAAEKEVQNARLSLSKQTDKKLKLDQEKFLQQTISNLDKTQKAYAASERNVAKLRTAFDVGKKAVASDITNLVSNQKSKIVPNASESIAELNAIKAKFAEMGETYNKLSKTRFLSKASVNEFKNDAMQMQERVKSYKEAIEKLKDSIRGLEQLHRKGLAPGSGVEIENYKTRLREMEAGLRNINVSNRKTINETDILVRKQTKSVLMSSWEMVRNFRWQVAAVYYLATKAMAVVKNTYFEVLNDIQKFRTSAMAIAASITYSMIGDISTNFNTAFEYSKNLMLKMEMEAAKTILTLEDMTMLVKTFTQAGIIPRTDEDIKKISTIGTAIKVLTEGMANAGVQMRQELYSIIQGRQRATDQVATMFGMLGINIQENLDKAKKEGRDLLDVLSEALEPFSEVNKAMAHDYSVQLEALEKIWDRVKRLGAERTYTQFSKSMEEFNKLLIDADGNLQNLGREWAVYVAFFTESLRLSIAYIMQMGGALKDTDAAARILQGTFQYIASTLAVVTVFVDALSVGFVALGKGLGGFSAIFYELVTNGPAAALKMAKTVGEDLTKVMDDYLVRSENLLVDVGASINNINGLLDSTKGKINDVDLGETFNLEYTMGLVDEFSKLGDALNKSKLAALSGVARYNEEYKQEVEKYKEYGEKINKNISLIEKAMKGPKLDTKKQKMLTEALDKHKKALSEVQAIEANALKERDRKTAEYSKKQTNQLSSLRAEYKNMLETFEVTPKTPLDQAEKKYDKALIALDKFIEKNRKAFSEDEWSTLIGAFEKGRSQEIKAANEEMQNAYSSLFDSMMSHKVLNEFEAIDNEFEKIKNNIEKSNNLTTIQKQALTSLIPILAEERKELQRITLELERQKNIARERKSYADVLDLSYRPEDKKQATLVRLEADYKETSANIQKEIEDITKKYKGMWRTDEGKVQISRISLMQKELENLGIIFEKHKKDVQEPFWKSLEDMSQGWADSLADTLTEVMFNMDSFEEGFKSFLEAILKDIVRSGIKTAITDNLLNMIPALGNYFKGGGAGATGVGSAAITGTAYGAGALDYMGTGYGTGSFIGMASGGVINEPIVGRGLRSGTSYAFGEGGASEVVLPLNKLKGNSSTPNVVVNVINQSGERMAATQQGKPRFDGEKFVVDVILRKMSTDPGFRSAMGRR